MIRKRSGSQNPQEKKAQIAGGSQNSVQPLPQIHISDAQDVQVLRDKICRLNLSLRSNCGIVQSVNGTIGNWQGAKRNRRMGNQYMSYCIREIRSQNGRSLSILKRLDGTSDLVCIYVALHERFTHQPGSDSKYSERAGSRRSGVQQQNGYQDLSKS
jgi:hypothetical protein